MLGGVRNIASILKKSFAHPLRYLVVYLIVITSVITLVGKNFNFTAQDGRQLPPGGGDASDASLYDSLVKRAFKSSACTGYNCQQTKLGNTRIDTLQTMFARHFSERTYQIAKRCTDKILQLAKYNNHWPDFYSYYPNGTPSIECLTDRTTSSVYPHPAEYSITVIFIPQSVVFKEKIDYQEPLLEKQSSAREVNVNDQFLENNSIIEAVYYAKLQQDKTTLATRSVDGKFKNNFTFELNRDRSYALSDVANDLAKQGVILNQQRSKFQLYVKGYIRGALDFEWQENDREEIKYTTHNVEFCPRDREMCSIKTTEEVIMYGAVSQPSNYTGSWYYKSITIDHYFGYGQYFSEAQQIAWEAPDYPKVYQYRLIDYGHDLSNEDTKSFYYRKYGLTEGHIFPLTYQKRSEFTTTEREMRKFIPSDQLYEKCRNGVDGKLDPVCLEFTAHSSFTENKITDQSDQSTLERSGEGYQIRKETSTYGEQVSSYYGVYDNQDEVMLVTESTNQNEIGSRKSPFENMNAYDYLIHLSIPKKEANYFKASNKDAGITVLSTGEFPVVPTHITLIQTFPWSDFSLSAEARKIISFLKSLKKTMGTEYDVKRVGDPQSLARDIINAPQGDMIILLGHGGDSGFFVGNDTVNYDEVSDMLEANQSIAYVISTNCFSYPIYSSSAVVLAAIDESDTKLNNQGNSLGSLFGIGSNPWTINTNDLMNLIMRFSKSCPIGGGGGGGGSSTAD